MTLGTRLTRWLLANAFLSGLAFLCAGTSKLSMMWAYLEVFAVMGLASALAISPELAAERSHPVTKGIDPGVPPLASVLFVATVAIGAFDGSRLHYSEIPAILRFVALAVLILAGAFQVWVMAVNPFFSTALRLQNERGHRLINHGPYRFIRHPGYLAMLLFVLGTALALGSTLALVPASIYGAIILARIAREDRFLIRNLKGYDDYIRRVRFRLVPGLW
jgi:protein-S-isoprenylcysteine O-methyltransferase Ste14